jgi:hypothetical protein
VMLKIERLESQITLQETIQWSFIYSFGSILFVVSKNRIHLQKLSSVVVPILDF